MDPIWVIVAATFLGPVAAVLVTRFVDEQRMRSGRRWDIFRSLMRARAAPLSAEFVGALNLLEVEFTKNKPVIDAWKAFQQHVNRPENANQEASERWAETFLHLRTGLLDAVARAVGVKVQQLDILRANYSPVAWKALEDEQAALRQLLADVLSGRRAVHFAPYTAPPPPGVR
jgi:hypothetical protein